MNYKKCTRCLLEKDILEFGMRVRKTRKGDIKKYICIYCKSCCALQAKLWRKSNSNKVKEINLNSKDSKKKWLENNKDKRKEYERKYYLNNIENFKKASQKVSFKQNKKIYKKNRRKNDPVFRVRENISNAILKALKRGKSNKAGKSIFQYLNYNIEDLKIHIQNQFDNKMSWGNYGIYWHIDHIIPQSILPYISMEDENFKKCWALSNLRPLEAKLNMSDGGSKIRHKLCNL